ncbi:PREDICTED: protein bassoon, partial [Myotis davidii]|uniref:protein bassoon n=1 Tax=Myotis davidii TaxID=225400 RepID=UPI00076785D7
RSPFQCHFSVSRRLDSKEPLGSQRAASPTPKQAPGAAPGHESPRETGAQGPAGQEAGGPRRTLQVDSRTQRSGRSPSVSPDRGSTPTSPYSVPQIAPLPSSTLCPICKTSDLTSTPSQPNFNTCTQCHSKVCNQCGFNPNPHLTQVSTAAPSHLPAPPPPAPFPSVTSSLSLSCPLATGLCVFLGLYSGSRCGSGDQGLAQVLWDPTPWRRGRPQSRVWVARVLTADTGMAACGISSGSRGDHTLGEVGIRVHRSGLFATRGVVGVGRVVCERPHRLGTSDATFSGPVRGGGAWHCCVGGEPGRGLAAWRSLQREALPPSSPGGTGHTVTWRPRVLAELVKRLLDLRTGDVGLGPGQCHAAQAAAPPERGKVSPQPPHPVKPSTAGPRPPAGEAPGRSATAVPSGPGAADQAQEGLTGKLFGLGASLLTQASTLMSVQPEADAQGQPASSKGPPKIVFSDASKDAGPRPPGSGPGPGPAAGAKAEPAARAGASSGPGAPARTAGTPSPKHGRAEQQAVPKAAAKPKAMPKDRPTCPLCQAELNVGSKGPANYNTCTACQLQVCNLCGFNPTPHLVEKSEWLCLNCQTKRLLEGSLGEPAPRPPPASPQPPTGAPHRAAGTAPPKQKGPQGPGQPSGPLPAKASPQAKPLRASEPSRTPGSAQEKKTGSPAKAEPVPKPPPETALPPGTPKAKAGARRTEPATPAVKAASEAPKGGEAEELLDLGPGADPGLDREPELEMESLTGSPEDRSRGEHSSTLPASTPSYTSGTSPTSLSSLEEDSDSSPSRRQRLEEAKQQRKARHRSHGPLLPTIEDSSEEEELREEEELLREQEKMREVEQQRIRSTVRKTRRDKEELRAQRRRERSKTPPSNLSPIEDASPTEELRQAAEMEELHRSSCSEYSPSPSLDSEAEAPDGGPARLYKSGSEYSLPTFMSLYSPTEPPAGSAGIPSAGRPLKSAEEAYEEMMTPLHSSPASPSSASQEASTAFPQGPGAPATTARGYVTLASPAGSERSPSPSATAHGYGQSPTTANYGSQTDEMPQAPSGPAAAREKPLRVSDGKGGPAPPSQGYAYFPGSSPPLSPSSPSESPTFSPGKPGPRATAEFSSQTPSLAPASDMPRSPGAPTPSPMVAQGTQTPHGPGAPRLGPQQWQQSSREAPFMVITLASAASSQTRMVHASASASPVCSPTDTQPTPHGYSQTTPLSASPLPSEPPGPPGFPRAASAGADGPLALYGWGALPAENISLCRISSVPGTSRVEPGPRPPGSAVVDLRTAVKPTPIILTDQGMDLTSLAVEARKYGLALDPGPGRQSTAVQPLVINLNAQEQTQAFIGTATTVSITVASSVLLAQQKQPVVYGDPFQSRLDFGQGAGSPVCLAQVRQVEQAVQTAPYRGGPRGRPREAKVARYNLPNQVAPLARRDVLITQMGTAQSAGLKAGPVPELGARKPHTVLVQMAEGTAGTVTTLLPEEPAGAMDLTGMRPESQLACCDVVYKFPFGSSCTGAFHPAPSAPEKSGAEAAPRAQSSGPFYSPRDPEPPEPSTYRAQGLAGLGHPEEQRPYPLGLPGRLYSSMSDTNLAEASFNYHAHRMGQLFQGPGRDSAVDLSSLRQSYSLGFVDGRSLGQGLQYGSFTDLRHPTDPLTHPLPMRRYSSVSNIYSDHRYGPRGEAAGFQEASLAQYSATTAREISRMCAALDSMDQYGGRRGSGGGGPDLMQYQPLPGKTGRGESLACQTEPDGQAQGGAGPQLIGPAAISPYLPGIQIVTPGPLGRFEKKKPDPLEIGYQAHLPPESLSQLVSRQPPKSPQVLYSPVSPLSPHRLLDAPFASSERLSKAHVSPQKHFAADGALRQQTLPRPVKTLQRSLSDPKPLSPTAEESAKERFSLYQHQGGLGSQVWAQGLVQGGAGEKEIDAKLKYLELGITQRKESLAKDRGGRDYAPLRGLGEHRDYLSDSELNQLRLQGCATPGQYADFPISAAAPATPAGPAAFQQPRLPAPAPQYSAGSAGPTPNGFPAHQAPAYPGPSTYPAPAFPPGTSYPAEPGLQSQQAFRPTGHYAAQTPMPTTQSTLYPVPADSRAPHPKPRQTSLADLEQKVPTNYEVIAGPAVAMSSAPSETGYSGPVMSSNYEQSKTPELPRASDRSSTGPAPTYPSDSHYASLEQSVPRNYVMIDDISELTKDSASTALDSQRLELLGPSGGGRPGKEPGEPGALEGPTLPCCYARGEEESEEDAYDPRGKSGPHRGMESDGRAASTHYYGDSDYRQGARPDKYGPGPAGPKHASKSLAPAAVSKRSKHRKQGMEQKVSKFSPIEEARDVESDLASYPPPAGSSGLAARGRRFQDEITYGLKKNVYEQQRHYGASSRDAVEEDDRAYSGSSRSRGPAAYSGEKLSSHDFGSRGKGYEREREAVERLPKAGPKPSSLSMAHGRARPPMRSQASEEESPVSPLGRPRPAGDALPPGDTPWAAKAAQQGRPPQAQPPPGPGPAGMKAGARPGGTPGAPAGQPGAEGDSMFSKILPGGAAEQAGKLTEAVSAFGKKFSSF